MKTKLLIISIAISLCLSAAPAMAGPTPLTTKIKVTDGPGSGGGGAFWAEVVQGSISYPGVYIPTGGKFLTFCIENNEFLSLGSEYWINIDTQAVLGGSGSPYPGSHDPLDPETAALYRQYLGLSHPTTAATANEYQLAIWKQEMEAVWDAGESRWEDGAGGALNSPYQLISVATINALIASVGSPSGIGPVRVMTLWGDENMTLFKQDLLVVPVPAAVLLGILGLGVAGIKLRKYA